MEGRWRRERVYRYRIDPFEYYDELDFIARYRLDKEIVRQLAHRYANSPYISILGDTRGSGINPQQRVRYIYILILP